MDFGVVGLDGLVGCESGFSSLVSEPETRQKGYGSGFLKQERSGSGEDDWRSLKMARTDDFSASKAMLLQQRSIPSLRSNSLFPEGQQQQQQQMLSFSSSPKSEVLLLNNEGGLANRSIQNANLPYYHHHTSSAYARNTGYSSNSWNASMHGVLTGARGPFTPSQWIELEHQALIFKYITANVPIPSNLLIPLRKALNSSSFSGLSPASLRPNTLGWGSSFHLGFSGNTDPEPGRCRRTDGKKWRCSRDAVADQKYCERHMNRGRHRSRKPVEGQSTGHAISGPTTTSSKVVPPMASSSSSSPSVVVSGAIASGSLAITHQQHHHQIKNLHPGAPINRIFMNKDDRMQDSQGLSMLPPSPSLKSRDTSFSIPKQYSFDQDSSQMEFGLVSSENLLNPSSHRSSSSSYMSYRNFGSSHDLNDQETRTAQHPLRHFIDDWPKNPSEVVEEMQLDRTQLSISIPVATSDHFSSSSSSPAHVHEKLTLSSLRLSREFDPIQMGLGVGSSFGEPTQRQTNWIPTSWETSMGGPLGEVLNNTNNNNGGRDQCNENSSSGALNLMSDRWGDGNNPRLGSSPTGVLQKTSFGSLSNSSAGSSPTAADQNNKTHEGASLCDDLLGSTLVNSSSIPSL